ncbi:MAG TPA: hypothetical protein DGG94_04095 [Micromonosporaceae bacterium]|nr:hypothetical protein [Micromonosporaceae bacterium]HCU48980.1 hypothetical protein [Micromonosporaceae bacterium]
MLRTVSTLGLSNSYSAQMLDQIESPARLEWWANSVTCLADVEVDVTISVAETGWHARAALRPDVDDEALDFLLELDPLFTLRFPDGSHIDVIAGRSGPGWLVLREVPEAEPADHRPVSGSFNIQ